MLSSEARNGERFPADDLGAQGHNRRIVHTGVPLASIGLTLTSRLNAYLFKAYEPAVQFMVSLVMPVLPLARCEQAALRLTSLSAIFILTIAKGWFDRRFC